MEADSPTAWPRAWRLTPDGRGGVATVAVHGPVDLVQRAGFRAASGRELPDSEPNRVVFGHWGDPPEDVVVCRTSESVVEVHCHGGRVAVGRIARDLRDVGVEWTDRPVPTGTRLENMLRRTLVAATTLRTATIALDQSNGRLRESLEMLRVELETASLEAARRRCDDLLSWSNVGRHLASPWNVVLTGRPNVGKSSLVNALLGYGRSIVFDLPGTTRDVVSADTAFDGWPVRLVDTAGLRDGADDLESQGINRARTALAGADCRLVLLDVSQPEDDEDFRLLAEWPDAIVVAHKSDLPCIRERLPEGALAVSSTTGAGLEELATAIVRAIVPRVPPRGTAIPVSVELTESLTRVRDRLDDDLAAAFDELRRWLA